MKRVVTSIIAAVFMLTAVSTSAFAQGEKKINPGITPDSILYPLDKMVENIQLKLTADGAKKINLLIGISTERFDEAEAMVEKNKDEKSLKAIEDGQRAIEDAEKVVEEKSKDEEKDEKLEKAKEELDSFTKKSVEKLTEIASRKETPEQASLVLTRVAAMQQVKHLEKLIKRAEKDGNTDLVTTLKGELGTAETAYDEAKAKLEEYKSTDKEEPKVEDKTTDKDKDKNNDKNVNSSNGEAKEKQNKDQQKDKKTKTN